MGCKEQQAGSQRWPVGWLVRRGAVLPWMRRSSVAWRSRRSNRVEPVL